MKGKIIAVTLITVFGMNVVLWERVIIDRNYQIDINKLKEEVKSSVQKAILRDDAVKKVNSIKEKEAYKKWLEEWEEIKVIDNIVNQPVVSEQAQEVVEEKVSKVIEETIEKVDEEVKSKISLGNNFTLEGEIDPDKVVNMEDIKKLMLSNLALYKSLLDCDNPVDKVEWVCDNIDKLVEELVDKKLNINNIYKFMLYESAIAKAVYYNGMMNEYKSAAVVMWIDKKNNLLKSIDIVRKYTHYNEDENDILPIVAKNININLIDSVPKVNSNIKIVLWLRDGSVVWLKVSPVDNNLSIPRASKYKVMEIKGYKACGSNVWDYDVSLYYGIGKIWIWKKVREDDLNPANTKWIKFAFKEKCYKIFDNTK